MLSSAVPPQPPPLWTLPFNWNECQLHLIDFQIAGSVITRHCGETMRLSVELKVCQHAGLSFTQTRRCTVLLVTGQKKKKTILDRRCTFIHYLT